MDDGVADLVDLLARRGALDIVRALEGGPVAQRSLIRRLHGFDEAVLGQRLVDLRRIGIVEEVPESGALRLSSRGRRVLGALDGLARA
ncbi:MAG TPA: hypothetical protein VNE21_05820, partial [Mycobacteriales bacterium]|nr:hypothetical protein [Mycobacteriales bacterium]